MKDLPVRVAHRTNTPCGPDARAQQNPPSRRTPAVPVDWSMNREHD